MPADPKTDRELLRAVVTSHSREAFASLVQRYLPLVYASARRQVGAGAADDLTQAIFLLVWERPQRVRDGDALAGWLLKATRLAAMQANRAQARRRRRESVACANRPSITGDTVTSSFDAELSPILDQAMSNLSETERTAVALRYLQDKSLTDVARATGTTEAAAAKRVSRGLDRLRRAFARQGQVLAPSAIGSVLAGLAVRSPVPSPSLATTVMHTATIGKTATAATIAKAVSSALIWQKLASVAAAIVLAATLVGGSYFAFRNFPANAQSAALTTTAPVADIIPPTSSRRIQVGVTVSKWTAGTNNPSGKPWGYDVQTRIVPLLAAPDLELYPVIEPGSETDEQLVAQIHKVFPGYEPTNAGDAEALKHLDVIVAHEDWMVPEEMLKGVEQAVREGVNLLNIGGMGWASPGLRGANPATLHLTGFTEAQGGYTDGPVMCEVIAPHPILGPLGRTKQLSIRPLGGYGILPPDATPLIKVLDMTAIHPRGPAVEDARFVFHPIYISHLDKGKIVGLQFSPSSFSTRIERARLLLRSVRWLAGRAVE